MAYKLGNWDYREYLPLRKEETAAMAEAFAEKESILNDTLTPKAFREVLSEYLEIVKQLTGILTYAELKYTENPEDAASIRYLAEEQDHLSALSEKTLFFDRWWKGLNETKCEELLTAVPENETFLRNLRTRKGHAPNDVSEKTLQELRSKVLPTLVQAYNTVRSSYRFVLFIERKWKEFSEEELRSYQKDPDKTLRKDAYRELFRVYAGDDAMFKTLYKGISGWVWKESELRNYASPLSARIAEAEIPEETASFLLDLCKENRNNFTPYFALKQRLLGADEFRYSDLTAPLSGKYASGNFNDAMTMVLEAFYDFAPQFALYADDLYKENHIGKGSGTFCIGSEPAHKPWISVEYHGKLEEVFALANALGSAIHSMEAAGQSILEQKAALPLAETGSFFAELLLSDRLEQTVEDPGIQRALLFREIDGFFDSVMKPVYETLFELKAGKSEDSRFDEIWLENQKELYFNALNINNEVKYEWSVRSRLFEDPFGGFIPAFSRLIVYALFSRYKAEGDEFIPKYERILSAGSSKAPLQILKESGFDFEDGTFFQSGFDWIAKKIERLSVICNLQS